MAGNYDLFSNNCPINEQTGDGTYVGRCWFYLQNKKICPRHGDVSQAVERYRTTGKLTPEHQHDIESPRK